MLGHIFDPNAEFSVGYHDRPHWSQGGAVTYVTFRTNDSIPADVIRRWEREKQQWLVDNKLPSDRHWSLIVPTLTAENQERFHHHFDRVKDICLDECYGECVLRDRRMAEIVADCLMHFDGERYKLGDFVIMPNHVHLLTSLCMGQSIVEQCDSWLHFSAVRINRQLGRKGKFWKQEPFDHLVRSVEHYEYLRNYIAQNGPNAGLPSAEYYYRRRSD